MAFKNVDLVKVFGPKEIEEVLYNAIVGLLLLFGFMINIITMYAISSGSKALMLGTLISFIACSIFLCIIDNGLHRFVLYTVISAFFGLLIIMGNGTNIKLPILAIVCFVSLAAMWIGSLFYKFFSRMRKFINIAFFVIMMLFVIFSLNSIDTKIIIWIVASMFWICMICDWGKLMLIPRTFNNAVSIVTDIYVEIAVLYAMLK